MIYKPNQSNISQIRINLLNKTHTTKMELTFNKYPTLGNNYILCKTLGKGGFSKVKLGFHTPSKQYHAIKIIKHQTASPNLQKERTEIEILSQLQHSHVIKMIGYDLSVDYTKKNGNSSKVVAIVMEFVPGCQLYQYTATSGGLSEKVARTYFKSIIESLEYFQEKGICHRDIKPENMLLDHNFQLKIIDFGLSTSLDSHQLTHFGGTKKYVAPEILLKVPYNGTSADLFSAGVILFMMMSGSFPFGIAHPKDELFSSLCLGEFDKFWAKHECNMMKHNTFQPNDQRDQFFRNEEFRHLINSMLTLDPNQRLTLSEIKSHPWYNGPTASSEELLVEMTQRNKILVSSLKRAEEEAIKKKHLLKLSQTLKSNGMLLS